MKLQTLIRTQIKQPENTNNLYPCVINKTDIELTNDVFTLQKKFKNTTSITSKELDKTLALEPETVRTQLLTHEQDHIRYQLAHNVTRLYKQQEVNKHK